MSATSNKSRIVLFLMIVIALPSFFVSFLAAAFTNGANDNGDAATTTTAASTTSQPEDSGSNCIIVRTAENRLFGECTPLGFSQQPPPEQ